MTTAPLLSSLLLFAAAAFQDNAVPAAAASEVPSPAAHLGRPVGTDHMLADWAEVSSYYKLLAGSSARVTTTRIGKSTEGRDFLLTVITSAANHARLPEIKRQSAILADPRGHTQAELADAVENGRTILFVSLSMHATETAGTEMGMQFSYLLATSDEEPWRSAREECVVVVIPTMNPDGLDHVVHWYEEHVGGPFEGSGLLELYQRYAGHDNNRDWFMLTQVETRIVTEQLYSFWHPQVYWDVHQQGSRGERMFVPPFRDPLNPNLDPGMVTGIDALGSRALMDLTRAGLTGISTGVSYDMWWNGGNRSVPVRHNIIGLLTEAASVDIASPIFLSHGDLSAPRGLADYVPSNRFPVPWPGGWWRLSDIIEYELGFARSLLGSLAREPELWRRNALEASQRTIAAGTHGAPRAWVIPSDNADKAAARRLATVLMQSGVELHVATEEFRADGRDWPAGSLLIRRDQPYGQYVKDLFEVQRYPDGDPPYDVAGWTLPLLLGVRRVELMELPDCALRRAKNALDAIEAFSGDARLAFPNHMALSSKDSDTWAQLYRTLPSPWNQKGTERYSFVTQDYRAGLLIPGSETEVLADEHAIFLKEVPRIGVYAPWRGVMNEGWLRWALEQSGVRYTRVRNEMLRAGDLGAFLDVLILPAMSGRALDDGRSPGSLPGRYARGLDPEGAVAIEAFVRGGGRLLALGSSSAWAVDLLQLPLKDVARGTQAADFACPGSILRTVPAEHPLTKGLPSSLPIMFSRSYAWRLMSSEERKEAELEEGSIEVLLRYAPTRLLLSGWIRRPETLARGGAWLRAQYGAGSVHLFGFEPQYRGWAQGTFHLIHRALLLDHVARD